MFRLFAIPLALLSLQAFAQTPPADPPVASLPLPEVAVQSLSSASGRSSKAPSQMLEPDDMPTVKYELKRRPVTALTPAPLDRPGGETIFVDTRKKQN